MVLRTKRPDGFTGRTELRGRAPHSWVGPGRGQFPPQMVALV